MKYKVFTKKEFICLLKANGFQENRTGKHIIFSRIGEKPVAIPKSGDVNPILAQKIIRRYNLYV